MKFSMVFEHSAWFIGLCLLIAAAFAFLLYYKDKKIADLSLFKRRLLFTFRFLSTLIISILLLSPVFKAVTTNIDKPIIVFAIDNSQSIALSNKFDLQNEQKLNDVIKEISKSYNVRIFNFDKTLNDNSKPDYKGQSTNITEAIDQIQNKLYNKNIGALVIVSDGIYNAGLDPVFRTENSNFSIYTVGIGDTAVYRDVSIKYIEYNEIVYLKSKFPVVVTINAKKLSGQTTVCSIYDANNKLLGSQNVSFSGENDIKKLEFFIDAQKAGVQQYTITVNTMEGEKNTLNNRKSIAVEVVENKQKILILANTPHPDIAAMQNAFKSNENFEVDVQFIEKFTKKISDYSLVIIHQLPAKNRQFTQIFQQIVIAKIPVLLILGTQTDYAQLNSFNFGFKITQQSNVFDYAYPIVNEGFSDFDISKDFTNLISSVDPLIVPFGNLQISANSKIILYQKIKNTNTNKPLFFITNQPNNSKILVILGEDFWRWRIQNYRENNNFDAFDQFFTQLAQYLVVNINKNRFIVKVDKINNEYNDIIFNAEAYSEIFELTNTNDATLKLTDSTGKSYDFVFGKTDKAYLLDIGSLPVGRYKYTANTSIGTQKFTASGDFTVIKANVESQNLVADFGLLNQLATKTGGKFYEFKQIDSLESALDNNESIKSIAYQTQNLTDIVSYKWIFFLILALLSVEWLLRKIFGTY